MAEIVDKNNESIQIGESVRFVVQKENQPTIDGFAQIREIDETQSQAHLSVWLEDWSMYNKECVMWPLTKRGEVWVAQHESETGECTWLEKVPLAQDYNTPLESWLEALSVVAFKAIEEEGLQFTLQGVPLQTAQVADPVGLLGAFIYQNTCKLEQVFGEKVEGVQFYSHVGALTMLSFDFMDTDDVRSRNNLFFHTHLLLEQFLKLKEKQRNLDVELNPDGPISLDGIVMAWLDAAKDKKFSILPYRPKQGVRAKGGLRTGEKMNG
jgi:hypothetical protein